MFTTIGLRLVELQFTDTAAFAARGLADRVSSVDLPAPGGAIYDRNGAVLAHSVEAPLVFADPKLADDPAKAADPAKTAAALAPLVGVAASQLLSLIKRHDRLGGGLSRFEYLARGIDPGVAQAIDALNLPGIETMRDERRDVPGNDLAANLIGFVGIDLSGLEGLEARYDELLRGVDGKRTFEIGKGDLDKEIPGGYHTETPPKRGSSLTLTIDRDLQYYTQRALSSWMRDIGTDWSAAVVLDVDTGEGAGPGELSDLQRGRSDRQQADRRQDVATAVVADPGSVHKAITIAAALQEGAVTPASTIDVAPCVTMGGVQRCDSHPFESGTKITLPGILAYSSNVGAIGVAEKLGAEKLYEYQRKFGLGSPTGE